MRKEIQLKLPSPRIIANYILPERTLYNKFAENLFLMLLT